MPNQQHTFSMSVFFWGPLLFTCMILSQPTHPSRPPSLPPYFPTPPSNPLIHNPGCPHGNRHSAAARAWALRRFLPLPHHLSTRGSNFNTNHTSNAFLIHPPTLPLSLVPGAPTGAITHSTPLRAHRGTFPKTPELFVFNCNHGTNRPILVCPPGCSSIQSNPRANATLPTCTLANSFGSPCPGSTCIQSYPFNFCRLSFCCSQLDQQCKREETR